MNKDIQNNNNASANKKKYGIVYKVTNTINNKIYIGVTTLSIHKRRQAHQTLSNSNTKNSIHFMRAIQKYGMDAMNWEEIDLAYSKEELFTKESYWINHYDTYKNGYNMTLGGEGAIGLVRSEEFAKDKSELVHRLRKEGKMGKNPAIDYKDAKDVRDLILKRVKLRCIASLYDVSLSSVKSLKNGTAKGYLTSNALSEQDIYDMSKINYSSLNDEDILNIRDLILEGNSLKNIADMYGVEPNTISVLKIGKSYRNIITDEDVENMRIAMPIKSKRILTEDELLTIKEMLLNNQLPKDIATHINCNPSVVSRIKKGERHSHLFTPEELEQIKFKPKSR